MDILVLILGGLLGTFIAALVVLHIIGLSK